MSVLQTWCSHWNVALLAEGVDRNYLRLEREGGRVGGPPPRGGGGKIKKVVGVHASVALLAEGVDRNSIVGGRFYCEVASPSSRRAWIEI